MRKRGRIYDGGGGRKQKNRKKRKRKDRQKYEWNVPVVQGPRKESRREMKDSGTWVGTGIEKPGWKLSATTGRGEWQDLDKNSIRENKRKTSKR